MKPLVTRKNNFYPRIFYLCVRTSRQLKIFRLHQIRQLCNYDLNIFRVILKILPILRLQRKRPIAFVIMVDNYPSKNEIMTEKRRAYEFLEKYKLKLAITGKLSDAIQIDGNIPNYEFMYRTSQERTLPRPAASANFFNLTNLLSMQKLFKIPTIESCS